MNDDCKQRQYSDQVHQPSAGQEGKGGSSHDCVSIVCAADIIAFSPHHSNIWGFPGGAVVKNPHAPAADSRDKSLIPGLGRSPGVESGNPLQHRWAWRFAVHGGHKESDKTECAQTHTQ